MLGKQYKPIGKSPSQSRHISHEPQSIHFLPSEVLESNGCCHYGAEDTGESEGKPYVIDISTLRNDYSNTEKAVKKTKQVIDVKRAHLNSSCMLH